MTRVTRFDLITHSEDSVVRRALEIYAESFPANERHPLETIRSRIASGKNLLYVGQVDRDVVFMALLWPLKETSFTLLDFMATKTSHRGRGIASEFLAHMREKLSLCNQYFLLEVENPKFGDNQAERARRVRFYQNQGAQCLRDVRYILPALDNTTPTEMILMVFPKYFQPTILGTTVRQLIVRLYDELYSRSQQDPLLGTFLQTIPADVLLD